MGTEATKTAMCQMQMVGKAPLIAQIDNDVELTRNVMIQPFHATDTMGLSKVPNHDKCINIIIKLTPVDSQRNEVYMMPGYGLLRAWSRQMGLALRHPSSRTVILKRGTILAHISATNKFPPMLAPEVAIKAAAVNAVHLGEDAEIMKEPMHSDTP